MSDKKCVQVALRIRPLVTSEITKGCKDILDVYSDLEQVKIRDTEKAFTYNYVFSPLASQDEVYNKCVKSMISNLFNGYNLTILAYGQTGSGKTHSMGTTYNGEGEMGVIPRAVKDIFDFVCDNFSNDFTISVSFMELYQEILYDLLADKSRDQCVLDIREDPSKGIVIPGLTDVPVRDAKEVFEALSKGSQRRATGATNMNATSSRSHAIFTVNICMQDKNDCNENKTAKFHLVDLAGSERPKKTGAVGTTFKEGVNINKGLLVLGNVISALGDEKQQHGHIPYRDSNLTRLLKDSLGGNSITLMIACVSPADYNIEETLSTLRYADRARKIQNKPIVNQDAKVAELNELRKTIQQLRLQILGQGGPAICPAEIELLKKDNMELRDKIRGLNLQLCSTLNNNTGLLERILILQNANETLYKKIQELKDEYNVTLDNISAGFEQNDAEAVKTNINKLQKIKDHFVFIDGEQKRTETEIRTHERSVNLNNSQSGDIQEPEMTQNQEQFANKQMAMSNELQEITKQLALKEHLARQITTNAQYMVDYSGMAENEAKILALQKEKDELLQQLKNTHVGSMSNKITENGRKRVQELEKQIGELNKKVQEQARLIKLKEKDENKIKSLNSEILQMKQAKVRLIRNMRDETDKFKTWKTQRERELARLKQEDRKKQSQIVKMTVMHSKQQNVLKRKVEEAVALNKRLKDALAVRKAAQDVKNKDGKVERVGQWIKQELDVYANVAQAKATLTGLLEDRAILQEQLDQLKNNSETADSSEIQSKEEDIEIRSVQIQDLQQKILDSDEDNKSKIRFDNIQTMSEAKYALKALFELTGSIKKHEVSTEAKLIEAQASKAELTEKVDEMKKIMEVVEYKYERDLAKLHEEYEEKVAVLLRQLRGVPVQDGNEETKQRCAILGQRNEELERENQELQDKIDELTKKLDVVSDLAQHLKTPGVKKEQLGNGDGDDASFKTPEFVRKTKRGRKINNTFTKLEQENLDETLSEFDDCENDPDWRKTPIGKYLLEKKKARISKNMTGTTLEFDVSKKYKRTSDGGCMCQKGQCLSRCGCKKFDKVCDANCKCSTSLCQNRIKIEKVCDINTEMEVDNNMHNESSDNLAKKPRLAEKTFNIVDLEADKSENFLK